MGIYLLLPLLVLLGILLCSLFLAGRAIEWIGKKLNQPGLCRVGQRMRFNAGDCPGGWLYRPPSSEAKQ